MFIWDTIEAAYSGFSCESGKVPLLRRFLCFFSEIFLFFFPNGFIFGSFLFIKVSLYYDSLRAGVHFTQYMDKNKILSESTPSTVKENQKTNKSEQDGTRLWKRTTLHHESETIHGNIIRK